MKLKLGAARFASDFRLSGLEKQDQAAAKSFVLNDGCNCPHQLE